MTEVRKLKKNTCPVFAAPLLLKWLPYNKRIFDKK